MAGVPWSSCLADYWVGDILSGRHSTSGSITAVSLARDPGIRPVMSSLQPVGGGISAARHATYEWPVVLAVR